MDDASPNEGSFGHLVVRSRMPSACIDRFIHPSAWKGNSPKFASGTSNRYDDKLGAQLPAVTHRPPEKGRSCYAPALPLAFVHRSAWRRLRILLRATVWRTRR